MAKAPTKKPAPKDKTDKKLPPWLMKKKAK